MSVFIASINSGSNGNCYYIGTPTDAVLIDAGISCRETEKRMRRLGLKLDKVKAIFITHEHTDHIYGAEVLAARYEIPVYITPATLQHSRTKPPAHLIRSFAPLQPVAIGGLNVTGFTKYHDAIDPHSFVVDAGGIRIGVFTDIGEPCQQVQQHFAQCHAAFLEANYDEAMLENGRYPHHLRQRIRGSKGHLSNVQALELFTAHRPPHMTHLLLSHLSKDNNNPDLALDVFRPHAGTTAVSVASRYTESPLHYITGAAQAHHATHIRPVQATLF